jgi:shikimate dehydrogenase
MNKITGKTRLMAVIGHPIEHSLSPFIHNRFARALGLDYAYMAFDVRPEGLNAFIGAAKSLNMAGFNLTMPLKRDILPYIDVLDESAKVSGAVNTVAVNTVAVNTVAVRGGQLFGYNTDGEGFVLSLESLGMDIGRLKAVVLGTGGAGSAVADTLGRHGAKVSVAARRDIHVPAVLSEACAGCSLLVNATPLGMHGSSDDFSGFKFLDALPEDTCVYDLIYHPRETALLKAAKAKGCKTVNGLPMLVNQAALAFKHFTGEMPPGEVISDVLEEIYEL